MFFAFHERDDKHFSERKKILRRRESERGVVCARGRACESRTLGGVNSDRILYTCLSVRPGKYVFSINLRTDYDQRVFFYD